MLYANEDKANNVVKVHSVINFIQQTVARYVNEWWKYWNKNYNRVMIFSVAIRSHNSPFEYGHFSLSLL